MKTLVFFFLLLGSIQFSYAQINWERILSKNKIVLLGEQTHAVASFYETKIARIKEMEKVSKKPLLLLIESPMLPSILKHLKGEPSDYHYHHTNTASNIEFLSQYENYGIDLQEDCRYKAFSDYLVSNAYLNPSDQDLILMDSILSLVIMGENYQKEQLSELEVAQLKSVLNRLKSKVLEQVEQKEVADLLRICFESRIALADYLGITIEHKYKYRIQYRDSLMAINVANFARKHKDKQIIVWAANLHIGKKGIMGSKWTNEGIKSMAEYLESKFSLYRLAIAKKKLKTRGCFDDLIRTKKKKLVANEYLEPNCRKK
jgi:hypothetical protein